MRNNVLNLIRKFLKLCINPFGLNYILLIYISISLIVHFRILRVLDILDNFTVINIILMSSLYNIYYE